MICGCSLSAADGTSKRVSIPPTLTKCLNDQWEQKVEFPVNIPALTRLLTPDKLVNISHAAYVDLIDKISYLKINVHPTAATMSSHES